MKATTVERWGMMARGVGGFLAGHLTVALVFVTVWMAVARRVLLSLACLATLGAGFLVVRARRYPEAAKRRQWRSAYIVGFFYVVGPIALVACAYIFALIFMLATKGLR